MEKSLIKQYMNILGYKIVPKVLEKYFSVPSLLRLKNIGYFCGMDYASKNIYNFREYISRYDHSITVALITWKLTGDIKATLAGLFHDISTPCFSHVIDYMNKDYDKQESTEEKMEEIIRNDTYLLECLKEDNIKVSEIIDFKKYSIVDLDRPMLCADRLDGVILPGLFWTKSLTIDDVRKIISDMVVVINEYDQKEIGFKCREVAELVLKTSELIDVYCHSKEDNYMMELLAKITKRAIDLKIITYDELYVIDEKEIFNIFDNSIDKRIIDWLVLFRNVTVKEITDIDLPYIKIRDLNPIGDGKRINENDK